MANTPPRVMRISQKLIEKGHYKVVIDGVYPFEQLVDAYKYVQTGEKTGNVVIKMA